MLRRLFGPVCSAYHGPYKSLHSEIVQLKCTVMPTMPKSLTKKNLHKTRQCFIDDFEWAKDVGKSALGVDDPPEPCEDDPMEPLEKNDPAKPLGKDDPTEPCEDDLMEPLEKNDPAKPLGKDDSTEPCEDDPMEPLEKNDPAKPLGRDDPTEPCEDDPMEPLEKNDPAKPLGKDDPTEPCEDDPMEPLEKNDPAKPLGKDDPAEPHKLARVILQERHYNRRSRLPDPADIERLNKYLADSINQLDYTDITYENYCNIGELHMAKLVMYNRRRTGEIEALRLSDYRARRTGSETDNIQMTELTQFEKHLLSSQSVMEVRGKTGRGVPVIIPDSCYKGLAFMSERRTQVGIANDNPYLFAKKGEKAVFRAYNALAKAASAGHLKEPQRITSTQLRKYMATVTRALDLKENELQWVTNHLGHSLDVHKIHYRQTSDTLERTQIAKILLLQDHDQLDIFFNKNLADIQMQDLVLSHGNTGSTENTVDVTRQQTAEDRSPVASLDQLMTESEHFFDDYTENLPSATPKLNVKRQLWSKDEENEILKMFNKWFVAKKRPKPKEIEKIMHQSSITGGLICKRTKDTLKKKIFRMIDKANNARE